MELDELEQRLRPFVQHCYNDPAAKAFAVKKMPGHAGFAYGYRVALGTGTEAREEAWFLRLPPAERELARHGGCASPGDGP